MQEPRTVAEAFLNAVDEFADNEAIVGADGRRFSYADMAGEVTRMVVALRALNCRPGDRVAIWLANRPEWIFLEYACALMGLLLVPVNARYRADEAEYVLVQSRAKLLFTQDRFLTNDYLARLHEIAGGPLGEGERPSIPKLPHLERIVVMDCTPPPGAVALAQVLGAEVPAVDLHALAAARTPDDPLWLFWTSGSTNRPKGAILGQEGVTNVWNYTLRARITGNDRILTTFPVYYIGGNYWSLLAAMLHGGAVIMSWELTAEEIVRMCRDEKVTVLNGIPFMLKDIVHDPAYDPAAFETVRMGFFGGATLPPEDTKTIFDRIGYDYMIQVYGMTELHGFATTTEPDDPMEVMMLTCGRALPGFDIRLVDPETGEDVPDGEPGEFITRGNRLLDYEGISDEDRARFFDAEDYYHTGDVLRMRPDGRYEFVSRIKDLIKVSGENVAAAEVELVLKTHPKVFTPQVIGVVDAARGEVPAALIELHEGQTLELEELRAWCHSRMAPFKVPRRLHIVPPGGWPRAASGKIARFKLHELL